VVAAALLHDVVEDTSVSLKDVRDRFGARVAELVASVTENHELPASERKRAYRDRLRRSSRAARAICAADKVCNIVDLHEAASSTEDVLARFDGGLEGQVRQYTAALSMLEETDSDRALRDAMRAELGALRALARRRACARHT
jgi:(p)ppGpp synthase/HD superfamily hydrolase